MKELVEGKDYYFDESGFFVFTENHHKARGYCCGLACRECPYDYQAVPEPRRSMLIEDRKRLEKNTGPTEN